MSLVVVTSMALGSSSHGQNLDRYAAALLGWYGPSHMHLLGIHTGA